MPKKNATQRSSKAPCLCGCTAGIAALWKSKVPATPEMKWQIEEGVESLVEKANRVLANQRTTLEIVPLRQKFPPPPDIHPEVQLIRLQACLDVLQCPDFFEFESGSYPAAAQWTSTLLTTILLDYSHLTDDDRYFSHIVALFNNQEVDSMLKQNNDDKLWVVLTCLRGATYAAIHDEKWVGPFLQRALLFYNSASAGWDDSTCGGGMIWGPGCCSRYKNAVTIELWITASVLMYEAFGDKSMLENSIRGWVWFEKSGMINDEGLVNDGLNRYCRNNGQTTWTYNQGIVLSGLSRLYKHTGDGGLIKAAQNLFDSVLESHLVLADSGVLVESCDPTRTCNQDQWMFKGVFFEHLGYFLGDMMALEELEVSTKGILLEKYSDFIKANAHAVWEIARRDDGKIGNWWGGSAGDQVQRQISCETHGSGVAAVCCAVRVDLLLESLQQATIGGSEF